MKLKEVKEIVSSHGPCEFEKHCFVDSKNKIQGKVLIYEVSLYDGAKYLFQEYFMENNLHHGKSTQYLTKEGANFQFMKAGIYFGEQVNFLDYDFIVQ